MTVFMSFSLNKEKFGKIRPNLINYDMFYPLQLHCQDRIYIQLKCNLNSNRIPVKLIK